jgi:hypothetical protein
VQWFLLLAAPFVVYLAGGASVRLRRIWPLALIGGAALIMYCWLVIRLS